MFRYSKREGYCGLFTQSGGYVYFLWGSSIAAGCYAKWIVFSPGHTYREYRVRLWRKQVGTDSTETRNLKFISANKPRYQYWPTFEEWLER